jgi:hypothetical protein
MPEGVRAAYALLACDAPEPDELEESLEGFDEDSFEDDPLPEEPEDVPESDDDPEDEPESDDPDDPDEELEPECSFSFDAPFDDVRLSVL